MGQGRENARTFLKENQDVRDKLELALRKNLEIAIPSIQILPNPRPTDMRLTHNRINRQ